MGFICPKCASGLALDASFCGTCGFSCGTIRAILGGEWVHLARVTDKSQRLSMRELRRLEYRLDDFERSFPQCFCAIYAGPLPKSVTPSILGFWMLNHGAFEGAQIQKRNEFGIALVVDTLSMEAALTTGYALEKALPGHDLSQALSAAARHLQRSAVAVALEAVIHALTHSLRRAGRRVVLSETMFQQSSPAPANLGFEPLRPASTPLPQDDVSQA